MTRAQSAPRAGIPATATRDTRARVGTLGSAEATVVGMSTVPGVVAARHGGIRVLVLTFVTNMVVGVDQAARRNVRDAEVRKVACPALALMYV